MTKFDDMHKEVIPDPLTGGMQTIYTSKDGSFMMSIPNRCVPGNRMEYNNLPNPITTSVSDDGKVKMWSWENPPTNPTK